MSSKIQDDELVMSLVQEALTKPPGERQRYLRNACGDDAQLLTEVMTCIDWENRMGRFLLEPWLVAPPNECPFEAGQLLEGRFRIISELARGGMGIVYDAMDEKLRRRIAIKCAKSGYRNQLPPEVRNASEISHPNVCKIFEIHTASTRSGDVEFFTMEFLDGETLAARLRRSPLSLKEAQTVALQLCAGLAEAHRKRVIHGDLKCSNILLTSDHDGKLRAVITDFGLARQPEGVSRHLPSAPLGGTPDYMAPELWRGAKPSIASDIYALGVILQQLLPEGLLPHRWHKVIGRCLQGDPALRFREADEVSGALMPATRRWFIAASVAVLMAAASGILSYEAASTPSEQVRLAVLPFVSEEELAQIAQAVNLETLSKFRAIRSSRRTTVSFLPVSPRPSREDEAAPSAATHVLSAALKSENEKIVVRAWILHAKSEVSARQWTATYDASEMNYVPVALAGVVTGTFRLPAMTELAAVNAAARQDYLTGLHYLRSNSGIDAALPLLERAVSADPDSALTHAALAEGRWWKYFVTGNASWRDLCAESVRQAERRSPDLPEVYRVAGLLKADGGRYEQAIADYSRAIELDPENGDAYRRLGMAYDSDGEHDRALAAFKRAAELDPEHYRNYQALANFFNTRANYREAIGYLQKAVALAPGEPAPHFVLARAHMGLGQFEEAEKELRHTLTLSETPACLNTLGAVLMYRGRDQEAAQYFSRALSRFGDNYLWWMNLGTAYRRLNLKTEAERANRRGLALVEAAVEKNPRNGYVRACLAYLCAWLGDRRRAESEVAQALQLTPGDNDTRRMAVKAYEALGRRHDSLTVLSTSPPDVLADVSRYPDLADLSSDLRFKQLLGSSAER